MLADGGEAIADLAVLRNQPDLFGLVASDAMALAQLPEKHRYGNDVLIRCDSVGASHAFLRHIRSLRELGVHSYFSVGVAIAEPIRAAITGCLGWIRALDADRELRDGAEIAEITHLVDVSAYPDGTRMIVRR